MVGSCHGAFGVIVETRYTWTAALSTTPAYALTKYILRQAQDGAFTGQYSYMGDPSA